MGFRFIGRQGIGRGLGLGTAVCALLGSAALGQTASDFIDPLDEERVRIETRDSAAPERSPAVRAKPAVPSVDAPEVAQEGAGLLTRAREGAATGAAAAQDRATGLWARMRAAVTEVAADLGLPTAGLLGLLGLLLAGLAALVGWTLFRGRRRRRAARPGGDVYARSAETARRRRPGDADPLARTDKPDEEMTPEDFEAVFAQERAETPVPPKSDDPATWRKPNLDRLRDSIKSDWMADKVRPKGSTGGLEPVAAASLAAAGAASERTLGDISDGWEEWDAQVKPEDDPWGETLTQDDAGEEDEAVRRIRALRESLRAS